MVDKSNEKVVPVIKDGRTLVPVRFVTEKMGATVGWEPATSTVTVNYKGRVARLVLGNNRMLVDGNEVILDVPAQSINGRTFIPLRRLAEDVLKKNVFYDKGLIVITDEIMGPGAEETEELIIQLTQDHKYALDKKTNNVLRRIIKPGMTQLEKEYAIFRYLRGNVTYEMDLEHVYDAYGALVNGASVCSGYMEAADILLKQVGIETMPITDYDHGWNLVKIGGKWYHFDATQNRFNSNDEERLKEGRDWDRSTYPKSDSTLWHESGWDFFVKGDWVYFADNELTFINPSESYEVNLYKSRIDGSEKVKLFTFLWGGQLFDNEVTGYFIPRGAI